MHVHVYWAVPYPLLVQSLTSLSILACTVYIMCSAYSYTYGVQCTCHSIRVGMVSHNANALHVDTYDLY